MHFIGVDLAWGEVKPSGVAVLDRSGRCLKVAVAQDDSSIQAVLEPYLCGEVLVAIDAPLIVNNPTGRRPAEAALNRDFGRFDAGAHPTNTSRPEFAVIPRGARLARAMGLDIDPASLGPRRAIEVYPHPASVALFRLGRTLKYKQKPGRSFELLRSELLTLMRLIEGLSDSDVSIEVAEQRDWADLRASVEAATRKVDLRLAEDRVDSVLCAYIARYAHERPDDVTRYGDADSGYIVTPTLPGDLVPTKRP